MNFPTFLAASALGLALVASPLSAQQMKKVEGIVVNIGIVHALEVGGAQHVIVSLAEEKSGARIGDAEVSIELQDPQGRQQRKAMMAMFTAGFPDYSEMFNFGWSGRYTLRVSRARAWRSRCAPPSR